MRNEKIFAVITSAALAATLGLCACGGSTQGSSTGEPDATAEQSQTTSTANEGTVSTDETTTTAEEGPIAEGESMVEKYDLTKAWYGQNEEDVTYYYEGTKKKTGAFLVYHSANSTYERWVGKMTASADGQVTITDDESGDAITLTIEPANDDSIDVTTDQGAKATLMSLGIDDVKYVLDTISNYASKPGEPAKTPTAEELGGEYLIHIGTDGVGSIAFVKGDEGPDYGDDAYAHANAGDKITLMAKTKEEGYDFVKWTKDGKDFSTDAEVEVTVEGDVEYIAVFEYAE